MSERITWQPAKYIGAWALCIFGFVIFGRTLYLVFVTP
jgi:hypothetical protein